MATMTARVGDGNGNSDGNHNGNGNENSNGESGGDSSGGSGGRWAVSVAKGSEEVITAV